MPGGVGGGVCEGPSYPILGPWMMQVMVSYAGDLLGHLDSYAH